MTSKEILIANIKEWIQNDNELKELQKQMKIRKEKNKLLTNNLVNVMKNNEIDCFDINDGKLMYTQIKSKGTINKKHLSSCLEKYFKNSESNEMIDDLCNFILDNREIKVTETIKRKILKE
jgi:hypothetical protein